MKIAILFLFIITWGSCNSAPKVNSDSKPISHQIWDELLQQNVNDNGNVNYNAFKINSTKLNQYLDLLSANHPNNKNWNEAEQLAYWINAYNAFTVKLIIDNHPLNSIKDIVNGPSIPFIHSPWDIKFIKIEEQQYDLNNIEHNILRTAFNEPRIHFAINCASTSCPRLLNKAYKAETLENQLQQMAIEFINDPSKNIIAKDEINLSKIFSWFKTDFTKQGDLIDFLNKYSKININTNAKVNHLPYDWRLNK